MSIKKLKYKRTFFNIEQMRGGTESIVTITNDGTIVSKYYKFGTRKVESVQKAVCSAEDFQKLCEDFPYSSPTGLHNILTY